jgi:two-component system chemotaxis sensor kinase CheA
MDQEKLLEIFITEASELVQDLEMDIVALEDSNEDDELINRIFRAAHTIKGSGGIAGLNEISDFTHIMENVLDLVRQHELQVSRSLVDALLEAVDILKAMIKDASNGETSIATEDQNSVLEKLNAFLPNSNGKPGKNKKQNTTSKQKKNGSKQKEIFYYDIQMRLPQDLFETGTDPVMLVRELQDLGEIIETNTNVNKVPDFMSLDVFSLYLEWRIVLKSTKDISKIEEVFIFVNDEGKVSVEDVTRYYKNGVDTRIANLKLGEILTEKGLVDSADIDEALSKQPKIGEILVDKGKVTEQDVRNAVESQQKIRDIQKVSTIRVDTDKLDKLVNLVGEMVIAVARVADWKSSQMANIDRSENNALDNLENICRDLQEQVMRVRMVPVEGLFSRFHRVVRDTANDLGKQIRLELFGTETELDKNVIEQISDPLKHLIRNSVDHGIEFPDVREKAGKPKEGTVILSAYQQEGSIIVEISDDGNGINRDAVMRKAIEKGLVREGEELSEKEIYKLMFEPGFSTAEKVTGVSGRGVGLDVVKQNIEELRGSIEVISAPGKGSTFKIRLPLTLAIIDGMSVTVGDEVFVIPLSSIIESMRPERSAIKMVQGKGEVLDARGEYLPFVRLHNMFGITNAKTDPTEALVVIVESSTRRFAILVDDVLGQQQAVIKSIEKSLKKVEGVAGATIQGDGTVALIIDIHSLEKMAFSRSEQLLMAC